MATAPSISGVPASAPASAPAPAKAVTEPIEEDTKTRRNAVLPAAAPTSASVAADDDRTVRIQRPALKKPTVAASAPASSPVVPKTPVVPSVPETPATASAPATPKIPAVPPKAAPPRPPVSPMPTQQLTPPSPADLAASNANVKVPLPPESGARPSALYTVVTLISLLLLLGSATLGVVHYLNFEHKTNIELPGIPFGK